ncbi:hypothetical protein [Shewanella sp. UCD-KL12]|uniref:hypothetical protein n=1 Tax=Shewanella sp. UCD-KL12 TaxID=1917163 RepID=UPI00117E08E7|nr:hypothetical protein [Shewanella sp. UCD-KL12]
MTCYKPMLLIVCISFMDRNSLEQLLSIQSKAFTSIEVADHLPCAFARRCKSVHGSYTKALTAKDWWKCQEM